jgi:hypothetical protein
LAVAEGRGLEKRQGADGGGLEFPDPRPRAHPPLADKVLPPADADSEKPPAGRLPNADARERRLIARGKRWMEN